MPDATDPDANQPATLTGVPTPGEGCTHSIAHRRADGVVRCSWCWRAVDTAPTVKRDSSPEP